MTKTYTATVVDTAGNTFAFNFAADNMTLAREHATYCTKADKPGATVKKVARNDGIDSADMGTFIKV